MSDEKNVKPSRKPAVFSFEDEHPSKTADPADSSFKPRKPSHFDQGFVEVADEDDPFIAGALDENALVNVSIPKPPRRFPFFKLALGGLGFLVSLAIGLWTDDLITNLFTRADWLGYLAIGALVVAILATLGFVARELSGLASLTNIQTLKNQARAAVLSRDTNEAKTAVKALSAHLSHRPETAKGRAALEDHQRDIIDNPGLMTLAEAELLTPLDLEARQLIASAARRVSVVTAVSPRALVDIGYVLFEAARLVSGLATLYGSRPGFFGLLKLFRETIAHLAVTGAIAVGDDAIQQVLGHGLASKVSAKLGEGVANGLMTARVGIAAMDLCRPMDFREGRRPKVTDFLNVLTNKPKSNS